MNRNFATFCLIIWIGSYIISTSPDLVAEKYAQLAGKLFTVFFYIWLACFILIVLHALIEYGKKEGKSKPFDWSSMK